MNRYEYLAHHGRKGQHWGERLYQNPDGSLTPLGRIWYGVGPAREKVKATVGKVKKARAESKEASKVRKAQVKKERAENKAARQKAKEERIANRQNLKKQKQEELERKRLEYKERASAKLSEKQRKLADDLIKKQQQKSLLEIQNEIGELRVEAARKRVEAIRARHDRATQREYLRAEAKALKKRTAKDVREAKRNAKRDARNKYSKKDIRNLSDQELNDRIERLKKEISLRSLEAQRNNPKISAATKWVSDTVSPGIQAGVKQLVGAKGMAYAKKKLKVSDKELQQFLSATKKK